MRFDYHIYGIEFFQAMIAGWRYLFSHSFRHKKHLEWRESGSGSMLIGLAFCFSGVLLSLALLALAAWLVWK